jgi:histidinol-phosphate phosphatase family protein
MRPDHLPATIFLDRDGTIMEDRGYLADPAEVVLLPGVLDGLRALTAAGTRLVVVTNQSGVARGLIPASALEALHRQLATTLRAKGIELAGIYSCPHGPEDGCGCRKPAPGLAHQASKDLGLDLTDSLVVGDRASDLGLARALNVPSALVLTGAGRRTLAENGATPSLVVRDLRDLARHFPDSRQALDTCASESSMIDPDMAAAAIRQHLSESAAVLSHTAVECASDIIHAARLIAVALDRGGKLLLCGNGGSAADCQHLAAEFVNVLARDRPRRALAAIALTTDTSLLTAVANDSGFEQVFSRQIEALGDPGDVLLAISTSGRSPNVVRALVEARSRGLETVLLTGPDSADRPASDCAIRVPARNPQQAQEAHIAVGHLLCALVERGLIVNRT